MTAMTVSLSKFEYLPPACKERKKRKERNVKHLVVGEMEKWRITKETKKSLVDFLFLIF